MSSYPIRIVAMLYDQTERNREWKITDVDLETSKTYISICKQDSNEIRAAIHYVFRVQLSRNSGNVVRPNGKKPEVENTR